VSWLGNRSLAEARETLASYDELVARRRAEGRDRYIVADRALGWRMQSDTHHPRWPYSTNRLGNRRSWPEDFDAREPARHVAILGNSHVHGDEVADEETWVYQMQVGLGPAWRVHNLGVTAYATDQAILRFLDFLPHQSVDVAVLAITTTEIYRNLNQCRAFVMADREIPLFKPRFRLDEGTLRRIDIPAKGGRPLADELADPDVLAALRRNDAFYPFVSTQLRDIGRRFHLPFASIYERLFGQALVLTIELIHKFIAVCRERAIVPVLMFLPVFWGAFPAGPEYDAMERELSGELALIDARAVFTSERLLLPRNVLHHRANHFTLLSAGWIADYAVQRFATVGGMVADGISAPAFGPRTALVGPNGLPAWGKET